MERLEDLKHELETKRQELSAELSSARGRITAIEADLKRIAEALGALTKKKERRRRPRKTGLTLAQLRRHLASVREELPFTQGKELEEVVRARVRQSGSPLDGFESLYAEALGPARPGARGARPGQSPSLGPPI